jgi:hypothetical protein
MGKRVDGVRVAPRPGKVLLATKKGQVEAYRAVVDGCISKGGSDRQERVER